MHQSNNVVNEYVEPYYYKTRSLSTFWQQNRCVFEISKEQYEKLLDSIKTEVEQTRKRTPNLKQDDTQLDNPIKNLYYNSNPMSSDPIHNCVTWVLNKLDSIGIEIIDSKEWLPDVIPNLSPSALARKMFMKYAFDMEANFINTLKDSLADLAYYHTIFRKFQSIDSNLESIKGAKAFRIWARGMIGNRFVCKLDQNYNRLSKHDITCSSEDEGFVATLQSWKEKLQHIREQLRYVYAMLDKILSSQIQKAEKLGYTNIQGDFTFIMWNDELQTRMLLDSKHRDENTKDYIAYPIEQIDPNIPACNWTLNHNASFILILRDEMLCRAVYKNYHYSNMSESFIDSINKSHIAILSGNDDLSYWSKSLHALRKSVVCEE